ncbi:helix-turn-helix domain-containing protein [Roseovarius dicentrarchi]|uniref:helix-turn-helix domain-containing protein n=1 Tax=Roseovarius dicentrarchi TaxID=2250573 RepID=UPI000DEAFF7D|nr:helix-turn-helix domain-containing protein [Roseovarius dicentrarchi]
MILRRFSRGTATTEAEPRGFDSFDLRLGDLMRGERATMGKSLLDVERELRIKASYVAAIENANPDAFDTPGFIPGYVRSYARYLGMDPDRAFITFCNESGFSTAHGMSAAASSVRRSDAPVPRAAGRGDARLTSPSMPFVPASESILSRIEPGAIGSVAVLIALISAIGYGGWSVLNEVQRVQVSPVENTPDVLADLDPLADARGGSRAGPGDGADVIAGAGMTSPEGDTLDRLYRPEALDVPVLIARDGPISTLDPMEGGTLPGAIMPDTSRAIAEAPSSAQPNAIDAVIASIVSPQVVQQPAEGVQMVAVRPAWVRVRAADGSVIYEGIMNAGDTYDVPQTEVPPTLRVGESGAIYFKVAGQHYGPAGPRGSVTSSLALAPEGLTGQLTVADLTQDSDLERYVAELGNLAERLPGEQPAAE